MTVINPCAPFEFNIDEGTRAFALAEFLVAWYNILRGGFYGWWLFHTWKNKDTAIFPSLVSTSVTFYAAALSITFGILFQGVLGLLLYPVGYANKKMKFCWLWIVFAFLNICGLCGVLVAVAMDGFKNLEYLLNMSYLMYNFPGIFMIYKFIKSGKHKVVIPVDAVVITSIEVEEPQPEEESTEQQTETASAASPPHHHHHDHEASHHDHEAPHHHHLGGHPHHKHRAEKKDNKKDITVTVTPNKKTVVLPQ